MPLPDLPTDLPSLEAMRTDQWKAVLDAPAPDAAHWMAAAAKLGHPPAQTLMGQWLLDGRGVARDAQQAVVCFLKAARQGDALAMNMAGRCYENGWGVDADPQAALRFYRQSADQGLAAGLYNLANQFASGRAVPRDDVQALALYTRAAVMGHAKSMTKAGRFHEEGLGLPQDARQALDCYRRGAEGGDFRGQFHYARMLAAQGDAAQSLHWLRQVPLTATPSFLQEAGELLAASADARFRALGQDMLARVRPRPQPA